MHIFFTLTRKACFYDWRISTKLNALKIYINHLNDDLKAILLGKNAIILPAHAGYSYSVSSNFRPNFSCEYS